MELSVAARHNVPGVKKRKIESRDEWLTWKKNYVGGSEIGALFGVDHYLTPAQLYARACGQIPNDFDAPVISDDGDEIILPPNERGLSMEWPAMRTTQRLKPHWRIDPNSVPGGYYFADDAHGLACTPDAFVYAEGEPGPGAFQIKSVAEMVYNSKWFENGMPTPPLGFVVQTMLDAALSGCSWGVLGAHRVGFGEALRLFRVQVRPAIIDKARALAKDFWRRVRENDPYPFDFARDGELISALYSDDDGAMVELDAEKSARMYELLVEREKFKAVEAAANDAIKNRKTIDTEIVALLGNGAGTILGNGTTVTAKTTRRGGYTVEPTSFRPVRVKDGSSPAKGGRKAAAATNGAMPDQF